MTTGTTTAEQLRGLYPAEDLAALDKVRAELLANPSALDNHSKEKDNG